jgi:uncharacterized protein YbjT (DUF2867 family)
MRVLLSGATGFIGSAGLARLVAEGHDVVAVIRRGGPIARRLHAARWVRLDMARATTPEAWAPHLVGIDAVVNCAGVLQDSPRDSTAGVHLRGAAALFAACESAGVRRVIQLSVMGADKDPLSDLSRTKGAGDEALMARDLDWVILRPSVVVGPTAYGASALIRGLAALPVTVDIGEAGRLQVVQLDEVARTVLHFLRPDAPARVVLEIAGPERLTFADVVATYRRWLGFQAARRVPGGGLFMPFAYRFGDLAGLLGWRVPVRSNARREMARGAVGDNSEWRRITGIEPRVLREALITNPASVQERWFAGLYLLKPLVFAGLAAFWLVAGFISLGPSHALGLEILDRTTAAPLAQAGVIAGGLAELAIGVAIAWRRTARLGLIAALVLSFVYLLVGTILQPDLWLEPFGRMMGFFPIAVLHLLGLAILEDR